MKHTKMVTGYVSNKMCVKYCVKSFAKYCVQMEDIANYTEVRDNIASILTSLRDTPNRCAITFLFADATVLIC